MDFIELFKGSPIWLQVYLAVIQLGALIPFFKVLSLFFRWLSHMVRTMYKWLDIEGRYIWFLYKPTVTMTKKPTISMANIVGDDERRKVTTTINLQFKGNDSRVSEITLEDLRMLIWQGWSKRRRRVILNHTFQNYFDKNFKLTKERISKEIELEGFSRRDTPESDLDFNNPYRWKVEGIRGRVFGTHSKFLPCFKGKANKSV